MSLAKMFNYFHNHFQAFIRGSQRVNGNINASLMMFIVIGITLCLPSAGLLLVENAGQISHNIEHEAEISIFLKKKVAKDQIDFINLTLKKSLLVKKIHFEAKLDAWEKLQTKLNLQSIGSGVSENPLPDAFFVSLNTLNSVQIKDMIQNLKIIDGIDNIVIDGSWIKKLRSILYLIKLSIGFLGALLIIVPKYRRVIGLIFIFTVIFNIVTSIFAFYLLGILGVALVTMTSVILRELLISYFFKKHYNFYPLGYMNKIFFYGKSFTLK